MQKVLTLGEYPVQWEPSRINTNKGIQKMKNIKLKFIALTGGAGITSLIMLAIQYGSILTVGM